MSAIFTMKLIYVMYTCILIFGLVLFSILSVKTFKDIKKSMEQYKVVLEKNIWSRGDGLPRPKTKTKNTKVKS